MSSLGKVRIGSLIVLSVLIIDLTIYFDFYPTSGVPDKVVSSNKIMGDFCDTQEILCSPEGMDYEMISEEERAANDTRSTITRNVTIRGFASLRVLPSRKRDCASSPKTPVTLGSTLLLRFGLLFKTRRRPPLTSIPMCPGKIM